MEYKFTDKQLRQITDMVESQTEIRLIADYIGCNVASVRRILKRYGLEPYSRFIEWTDAEMEYIYREIRRGVSVARISKIIGKNRGAMEKAFRKWCAANNVTGTNRYYIATSLKDVDNHNGLRDELKALDFQITYDWTKHGPVWDRGQTTLNSVAENESNGVMSADFIVAIINGSMQHGTHVEIGCAIAAEIPIVFVPTSEAVKIKLGIDPSTCVFYHHRLAKKIDLILDNNFREVANQISDLIPKIL